MMVLCRDLMEIEKQSIENKSSKCDLIFSNGILFILVLILVDSCVELTLVKILITHLTKDGSLALPNAVMIVNVQDGTTAFLVLVVAYVSDAYLGPFMSIVCTSLAYITGLWILYFAASHSKSNDSKILLYAAVILISLGRAGCSTSLKELLGDQLIRTDEEEDEKQVESQIKSLWHSAYMLALFSSLFIFIRISWIELCMASGVAMGVAFLVFLAGSLLYEIKKPSKFNKNNSLRVVCAAIVKRHLSHSHTHTHTSSAGISILRWLDKAAIVEQSLSVEEQIKKSRLYTIEQVEETKSLINMAPLCTSFLVYGLLQATGNTFFLEQTKLIINHNVSTPITFVVIKIVTAITMSWLCNRVIKSFERDKNCNSRFVMLVRIGFGMMMSPLCCLVAWRVQENKISNRFFLLLPQFMLLGSMEGLVFDGLVEIYSSLVPTSLSKYGPSFAEFALGIGHFLGLIFVLVFHNLFSDTIEESRLGVYYRNLGFVCFVNLLFYFSIVPYYVKQEPFDDDDQLGDELQMLEEEEICAS